MKKSTSSLSEIIDKNGAEKEAQSFKKEFSKLNEDLQTILRHVKSSGSELTKDVSNEVWSKMEGVASRLSDINQKVTNSASDFVDTQITNAKEKTQEYANDLENTIRKNPLSSVAISFGIGLIISRVLGSWHSSH
ncbi:MAG: hypothetical protein H6492_01100 [Candidatus Paracaedibacteraceae bacterium]|nr:hypothetical protein [Candidatus Paracaedibacteraceae bacterium]